MSPYGCTNRYDIKFRSFPLSRTELLLGWQAAKTLPSTTC
jgi:hypothetical protein